MSNNHLTAEQLAAMTYALKTVKFFTGVGNNAAHEVMLHAHDQLKHHRRYNNGSVRQLYRRVFNEYAKYEHQLLYESSSYFETNRLTEADKKRYGEISRQEFFQMWTGMGTGLVSKTWPLITSLQNKFRLSLINHHIDQPELMAWAMTAQACLDLADYLYDWAVRDCQNRGIRPDYVRKTFGAFSMKRVSDTWRKAMKETDPATATYTLDPLEQKNIDMGMEQLYSAWLDPDNLYDSTITATEDFSDDFRTKGEAKKAAREWAELRAQYHDAIEQMAEEKSNQ